MHVYIYTQRSDDLIFHVLLEFEKHCGQNISDATRAQSTYLGTVVNKFPAEAVNILAEYFSSMNDVKHVMNLYLKGQNYAKAGSILAKRALSLPREHERLSMLQEASRIFGIGRDAIFQKTCSDEYLELLLEQEVSHRLFLLFDWYFSFSLCLADLLKSRLNFCHLLSVISL